MASDLSPRVPASPASTTSTTSSSNDRECREEHRVGFVALCILIFYSVSGGPFGCEAAVRSGGVLYTLLGFAILPLIWSVPEAMVTSELGSAYPEASGSVVWVEEAFGGGAGVFVGFITWVCGTTDNAIYPALFLEYLTSVLGKDNVDRDYQQGGSLHFMLVVAIALLLSFVNYTGLPLVGRMSVLVCIISMSPFILLSILALPKIDPQRWLQTPNPTDNSQLFDTDTLDTGWLPFPNFGGVLWRPFLNNLFWNLNSFDSAANFAGDTHDPGRIFPRAMFAAVVLVASGYFLPLLVATGATASTQQQWTEGHIAAVSSEVVGPWLGGWTVFASAVSNIALYEAEMSSDSLLLMGMAQRGLAPRTFARRSRFSTPTNGILLGTAVVILVSKFDFSKLVEILNFACSIALLMEYAAFIKLRITHQHVYRPYRIPTNTLGCICLIIPPCALTIFVMMLATWMTYLYVFFMISVAVMIHYIRSCLDCTSWHDFKGAYKGSREAVPLNQVVTPSSTVQVGENELRCAHADLI